VDSGVLITGPVGAGKTAIAIAAGDILQERGAAAAIVDLDWLGWLVGCDRPISEVIADNLRAILPILRGAGASYLILTRAMEADTDIELFRAAVSGTPLTVAHITATLPTIEERLRRRDTGTTLEEHLVQAKEMESSGLPASRSDIVVSNEGRTVEDTAGDLLETLGWL
jgi:DNA helicase TIP49 (TBP-interacting protein)